MTKGELQQEFEHLLNASQRHGNMQREGDGLCAIALALFLGLDAIATEMNLGFEELNKTLALLEVVDK